MKRINETRDVHPLVAIWLTKNGYSYIHEYKMPEHGQVDFFATHSDGHKLLVEAKGDGSVEGAIFQVLSYGLQIPDARLSVAAPKVTEKSQSLAEKYNVSLIVLGEEIPEHVEPVTPESLKDEFVGRLWWIRFGITNEFAKQEQSHERLTHVYNSIIFNMSTDLVNALIGHDIGFSQAVEATVKLLLSYLRSASQAPVYEGAIGLWLLQDTSNGDFQHIVKFADDFGVSLPPRAKVNLEMLLKE